MVKQELVQLAMERINKPCTTKEIGEYLLDNKLTDPLNYDIKIEIATQLTVLKKWEVVDCIPQGHGGHMRIWYLTKNGNPHNPEKCYKCKKIGDHYRKNVTKLYMRSALSKIKHSDEDWNFEEYGNGNGRTGFQY